MYGFVLLVKANQQYTNILDSFSMFFSMNVLSNIVLTKQRSAFCSFQFRWFLSRERLQLETCEFTWLNLCRVTSPVANLMRGPGSNPVAKKNLKLFLIAATQEWCHSKELKKLSVLICYTTGRRLIVQ